MNLLLDTQALLWWLADEELDDGPASRIADPAALVVVSAASVWEATIKAGIGKLELPEPLSTVIVDEGFEPLAGTVAHAEAVGGPPPHHRDPVDRMLIAQARVENLTIVTRDPAFAAYDVAVLPC